MAGLSFQITGGEFLRRLHGESVPGPLLGFYVPGWFYWQTSYLRRRTAMCQASDSFHDCFVYILWVRFFGGLCYVVRQRGCIYTAYPGTCRVESTSLLVLFSSLPWVLGVDTNCIFLFLRCGVVRWGRRTCCRFTCGVCRLERNARVVVLVTISCLRQDNARVLLAVGVGVQENYGFGFVRSLLR